MFTIERRTLPALTARWAAAALWVGVLAGCGSQTGDVDRTGAEPTPRPDPTNSASTPLTTPLTTPPTTPPTTPDAETPSEDASPAQTPTGSTAPAAATGLAGRLLEAAEVPEAADGLTWSTGSTGKGEGAELSGLCHEFALDSIGAFKVVHRTFAPVPADAGAPAAARAVVAQFPDAATARRADAVLRAWHEKCAERHADTEVGPLQEVPLDDATGGWYGLTRASSYDAQGYALRGSRIAVLTLRTGEPDQTSATGSATGEEPMEVAVMRAAAKL